MYKWQSKFDSFAEKVCTPPTWAPTNLSWEETSLHISQPTSTTLLLVVETSSHISQPTSTNLLLVETSSSHISLNKINLVQEQLTHFRTALTLISYYAGQRMTQFKIRGLAWFKCLEISLQCNAKLEN